MPSPISVRKDLSASHLRQSARKEQSGRVCRRLLGIAHLLETGDREEAEKIACLTQTNFLIWLKRFNAQGIAGLKNKKQSGRPPKLSPAIQEALKAKVLQGPGEAEGIARYRLCDLQRFLQEQYQISMCCSGIWHMLHELGLSWKTGRQRHPKSNEERQTAFKKTSSQS